MASTDPRKTRDFGPTSEPEDYDADEDPLVELARIVSEDGGFSGRRPQRPQVEPAPPAADTNTDTSDLEAELLEELETSFPSRTEPPPRTEPPVSAEPEPVPTESSSAAAESTTAPPAEPAARPSGPSPRAAEPAERAAESDDPDDLLRSIEEQLSQFEQRVRADDLGARFDFEDEDEAVDWSGRGRDVQEAPSEPVEDIPPAPATSSSVEYRFRGPAANRENRREPQDHASLSDEGLEVPTSVADVGAAADVFGRPASARRPSQEEFADESAERAASASGGEQQPDEPYVGPDPAGVHEAEATAQDHLSGLEAELTRELGSAYHGQHAGAGQDEDMSRAVVEDDTGEGGGGSGAAAAAVIAPEHRMRPPPRPRSAPRSRGRSRKGLVTAAGIVLVVLVGGAAAMYIRSLEQGPSGPPPVIAAPEGPVKVEPAAEEQADAEETVGQTVYDQVAGRVPETEENVVEGAEEPREIERIVLPQSQGDSDDVLMRSVGDEPAETEAGVEPAPATGTETQTATEAATGLQSAEEPGEAQGDAEEFGPRRVSTYVVRPDGTIVSTAEADASDADAGDADLSGQELAAAQTEAMDPKPVQTVTIDEPRTPGTPGLAGTAGSESASGTEDPATATIAEDGMAAPTAAQEAPAEGTTTETTELARVQPSEEPAPPAPEAVDEPQEPQEEVAAAPVPPTAASGFLVQLSAQTSPDAAEATFADLRQRYPSILGDLEANIQRADLGDRGIYYRVRVGPWAERADAVQVCESLQAAGGDCYVTQ